MHNYPSVSVIIPWANRDEIARTLEENSPWLRSAEVEVILVNCGGDAAVLEKLISRSTKLMIRQVQTKSEKFNKSLALNLGVANALAKYIFLLDADIIVQGNFLELALKALKKKSYATIARVIESTQHLSRHGLTLQGSELLSVTRTSTIHFLWKDGSSLDQCNFRYRYFTFLERAGPGLIVVSKENYLRVGGFVSEFTEWGWEDHDFQVRLQKHIGLRHIELGEAVHLSHGDDKRNVGAQGRQWHLNFERACARYAKGMFLGTYDSDVAAHSSALAQSHCFSSK